MSYGHGYGQAFGGTPLISVAQAVAEVGGDPVVFDLTDEAANAPLPGNWEHYALDYDGAGAVAYAQEPTPGSLFRAVDGKGLFAFARSPALPGPADPHTVRGYAASPVGVLEGRDGSLRAVVVSPTAIHDGTAAEFSYRVALGLRWEQATGSWVGAVMRAAWNSATGWTTRLALDIVSTVGGVETVLASAPAPSVEDPLDIWRNQPQAELFIELRGTTLTATLSGTVEVSAQVPATGPPGAIVFIEATNRAGALIVPSPALCALQVRSFRDVETLGPGPQIPGSVELEIGGYEDIRLPIQQLLLTDSIKRIGGRQFKFTEDITVEVSFTSYKFRAGEVVRILEALGTQTFVRAVRDLGYARGQLKGGS